MASANNRYRYLLKNFVSFLCANIGTKLISFFMVPLYTNILLPAEYGEVDLILSVAGVISPFLACGIHEGIMRFCLDKNADHKTVLSIGLRFFFVSSLILLMACPLLGRLPILGNDVWFLYLYCLLNEMMTIFLCYIRGKDHTGLYAALGCFSAFATATLNILFLVVLRQGLYGYKVSMLLSPLLTMLAAVVSGRIYRDFSVNAWDGKLAGEMLRYSLPLIPNAILWWCINASDRFFVSSVCGNAENGIYAVAYKIPSLLGVVASIFMQAWQMSAIKEHEEGEETGFPGQVYGMLTFFMAIVTMGLILVSRTVLSVYVGPEYQSAWQYSPPLMAAFFAGALDTFWGSFYIAAKNMKKYLLPALIGAILNVGLNDLLIHSVGTVGAAIATLISYVVVLFVRATGIEKQAHVPFLNRTLVTSFVCITVSIVAAYLAPWPAWTVGSATIVAFVFANREYVTKLAQLVRKYSRKKA